jgi:hypothetical protein
MSLTTTRGWIVAAVALAMCGAGRVSAQEIKTYKDEKADFTALRTYAWLPPVPVVTNVAPDAVSNPTLSQEALGPAIVAAVDRELAARGFVKAAPEAADLHVAYFAALTVGFNQSYLGEHYGYITGWGSPIPAGLAPSTSSTVYERGTVMIDLVDRAKKRAIWRGSVITRIHQEHTLDKRVERIDDAAAKLFRRFPIAPK